MTRMMTTNQKKNTTIPGIAYPATLLDLATASSYPAPPGLSATGVLPGADVLDAGVDAVGGVGVSALALPALAAAGRFVDHRE